MGRIALLPIIAHARSGALARAKAMFAEAGLDRVDDDPAVLSVKGRLLKDEALSAKGRERKRLYRESARAYARAAELNGATYPLINAATLSLLAGERRQADLLARRILASNVEEAETPYWRGATRAEAQLLLGDTNTAKTSLDKAIACAPEAYEDHASTLRQFGLILDELRESKDWLEKFRPPRTLHFAGHIALATARGALDLEIRKRIAEERVGFGYGALAAGADILIAEALLEANAELHLLLPASLEAFRANSVARSGASWAKRFDAVAKRASTIRIVGRSSAPLSPLGIRLAAEVAMGGAVIQAETLMTEAVQLLIVERKPELRSARTASSAIARAWRNGGRRQHLLTAPRLRTNGSASIRQHADKFERLAAVLRIDLQQAAAGKELSRTLSRVAKVLAPQTGHVVAPHWTGEAVIAAFETPAEAAKAALAVSAAITSPSLLRIGGDYGVVRMSENPFGGAPFLTGAAAAAQIVLSTPDGAVHVTEDFAAALYAGPAADRPHVEFIGELPTEPRARLFSLRR